MSEIDQYFDGVRRDVKSKEGVASVKTRDANRDAPKSESREYEVYVKSAYQDDVESIAKELSINLGVETTVTPDADQHFTVEAAYTEKR